MLEALRRAAVRIAGCNLVPLLLAGVAFTVLRDLLHWPPTVAVLTGGLAGLAAYQDIEKRVGLRFESASLGRVVAAVVVGWGVFILTLLLVRRVLVAVGWLPGVAGMVGFASAGTAMGLVRLLISDQGQPIYIRGTRPVSRRRAYRELKRQAEPSVGLGAWLGPRPVWCGVSLPRRAVENHFLTMGMPGAGKSTLIRVLMGSVLPSIGRLRGHRAIVYDDKRDFLPLLRRLVRRDLVQSINPFDQDGCGWDIAADVRDPATAAQVATTLIPSPPGDRNVYFTNAARELLTGVMEAFIALAPDEWTFWDLVVAVTSPRRLRLVLSSTETTMELVDNYFQARSGPDIISTLRERIGHLRPVAAGWRNAPRLSLTEWVRGAGVIVLSNDEQFRAPLLAVNQTIFNYLAQLLLNQDEPVRGRTWVFLDEMREASELHQAHSLLNRGRSKKVTVVIGFQAIEGLRAVYGASVAEELVGQCGIKALLAVESLPSREWASKLLGSVDQIEIKRTRSGRETTLSEDRQTRPVSLPEQFAAMPRLQNHGRLAAWCLTPYSSPFFQDLQGAQLDALTRPTEVTDAEAYLRREPTSMELGSWTDEDYHRLGLKPPATASPRKRKPTERSEPAAAREAAALPEELDEVEDYPMEEPADSRWEPEHSDLADVRDEESATSQWSEDVTHNQETEQAEISAATDEEDHGTEVQDDAEPRSGDLGWWAPTGPASDDAAGDEDGTDAPDDDEDDPDDEGGWGPRPDTGPEPPDDPPPPRPRRGGGPIPLRPLR